MLPNLGVIAHSRRVVAPLLATSLFGIACSSVIDGDEEDEPDRYDLAVESGGEHTAGLPAIGNATSEGVVAHQADKVVATGIDGTGVMVCVISDGIDSLAARRATGDLPAIVTVGPMDSGDTGTAMLEIIHDLAPGAVLGFASGWSETQMAANIDALRIAGCDVIVDDMVFASESAFQDGPIALAIDSFTAAGRIYFSAANDLGSLTHLTSGTFEGDFVASGTQDAVVDAFLEQPVALASFGALPYNTLIVSPQALSLQWADPRGAAGNDYDLLVLNNVGTKVLSSSTEFQSGAQDPLEVISCTPARCPAGARVVVALYSGAPRALRLQAFSYEAVPKLGASTAGGTFGHNAAAQAITIGAVNAPSDAAFVADANVNAEDYSGDGLRRMFYNADGSAITPDNLLFATGGGVARQKVDLAAADAVTTEATGSEPFWGTSAAAAHAAGIAALIKSANQSSSPSTIRNALLASALDIQTAGHDRDSGAGIVMAPAAVRYVLDPVDVRKRFTTSPIQPGATTALEIRLSNLNTVAIKGMSFVDSYPASIVNASSPSAQVSGSGCSGSLAATAGGGSLSLTGGVVPPFSTCTVTVQVTGNTPGTYVDSSGGVTTPMGMNSPAASASLNIATAQTPVLKSAASRKLHAGSAGSLDLPLLLTPSNPTTEPRTGATAAVVMTFDRVITGASVAVTEGGATAGPPVFTGKDVIINLSGIANASYVTVALSEVTSADGGGGSGSVRIGFLAADVNGSRTVSLSDMLAVNAALTQPVTPNNSSRDVNLSGALTLSDLLVVNANLTRVLPAP